MPPQLIDQCQFALVPCNFHVIGTIVPGNWPGTVIRQFQAGSFRIVNHSCLECVSEPPQGLGARYVGIIYVGIIYVDMARICSI